MRSFVVIVSVVIIFPSAGCFSPQSMGPIGLRSARMPLLDDEQLDLDGQQVIERLNDEQVQQAKTVKHSNSVEHGGVAEKPRSAVASEEKEQNSNRSPNKSWEQRQLEQTERIIELMEKTDDEAVRRVLAERILNENAQATANAGRAGQGVQFAAYTDTQFIDEEDLNPLKDAAAGSFAPAVDQLIGKTDSDHGAASELRPRRLNDSGLPIEPQSDLIVSATAEATVASNKPVEASRSAGSNRKESETVEPFHPGSWKQELHSAISALEKSLYQHDLENNDQATLQIYLRLLHLIANNKAQATRTIPELDDDCDRQFWQCQMTALSTLLDSGPANSSSATFQNSQRATTDRALEYLRQAINQLSRDANLQIENVALCREVNGYGQFETFKTNEFLAKQQVLIYCELENFVSVPLTSGQEVKFETEMKGSFTIFDDQLQAIYQHEYSAVRDIGQRRRRDFYMYFPMTIPQLPSGSYSLQLEIEDLKGNKAGTMEKPLPFVIR